MKTLSLITVYFLFFSLCCKAQEEQAKPRCEYSDWADHFFENEKYVSLLEQACKEINAGNYKMALQTMDQAISIDSAKNGADNVNVFIDTQYRRLKDYIENSPSESSKTEVVSVKPDLIVEKLPATSVETPQAALQPEPPAPSPVLSAEPVVTTEVEKDKVIDEKKIEVVPPQIFEPIANETAPPVQKEPEPEILNAPNTDESETVNFSETEKVAFQEKGMQKVKQLENFIFQIGSKTSPMELSSQSIENALLLFDDPEKRTVQVSSLNTAAKPKFKIKQYLQRVRNLNYDEITIEWADLQYTSDFTKGPDGNYYAYVVFSQRFTGSKDNMVVYQDVTTKRTEIVLKIYEKAVQGEITKNWDVFLGDISVVQTDTN